MVKVSHVTGIRLVAKYILKTTKVPCITFYPIATIDTISSCKFYIFSMLSPILLALKPSRNVLF